MSSETRYDIGIDIGGTFTDVVAFGTDDSVWTRKVPSTPTDYTDGIILGLEQLFEVAALSPSRINRVVHATTIATNAVLEAKAAPTALLTTEGFRDVLELRRVRIPDMYNLDYQKPPALVARRLRLEVRERIGPNGEVRIPLDVSSLTKPLERMREEGVTAVAIALLHAYANPAHELSVEALVREHMPVGTYISCSHRILPEIREYERTSTTVINAMLGPVISGYLDKLKDRFVAIGIHAPIEVMQSNGGLMSVRLATEAPARLLESGPAAGVVGAASVARQSSLSRVITLDMGGTTAKTAVIEDGVPAKTTEYEVGGGINLSSRLLQGAGYAVKLPFIDVSEIGAGGGSVVWFDRGGMMQVGPQSAGASPGPVCYGMGGEQTTLTDAMLVLGYINPKQLVGGALSLDADLARLRLEVQLADRLQRTSHEAAYGVFTIAVSNMIRAVKAVSTYRGRDPRDYSLIAFGGNGPTLAIEIARDLGMPKVLVPSSCGVFSALGLLLTTSEYETQQTLFGAIDERTPQAVEAAFCELETNIGRELDRDQVDRAQLQFCRSADLRYAGQAFELTVPLHGGPLDEVGLERLVRDFHAEHLRTYSHHSPQARVELVNIRVTATTASGHEWMPSVGGPGQIDEGDVGQVLTRPAYFGAEHGCIETPVVSRAFVARSLKAGPLVVEDYDATCVIPPGSSATLDSAGNLIVEVGAFH